MKSAQDFVVAGLTNPFALLDRKAAVVTFTEMKGRAL
jgi:hypothetical protein